MRLAAKAILCTVTFYPTKELFVRAVRATQSFHQAGKKVVYRSTQSTWDQQVPCRRTAMGSSSNSIQQPNIGSCGFIQLHAVTGAMVIPHSCRIIHLATEISTSRYS